MQSLINKEKIIIVDFGSQVTKLIARRIRESNVYSEILSFKEFNKIKEFTNIKGVILSGGPSSVTSRKFPNISTDVFKNNIPVLGICYGLQIIAKIFGGIIKKQTNLREFGKAILKKKMNSEILSSINLNTQNIVWMSHQDKVIKKPKNFKTIASTENSKNTIIEHKNKKIFGVQFHPEVTHTAIGKKILENFIFSICLCKRNWKLEIESKKLIRQIKITTANQKVICALSGGVDSAVTAVLIQKAIGKNLTCIMVDTGFLRKNEFSKVYRILKKKHKLNIKKINAQRIFLNALKNIKDPERKRKIIGKIFIRLFEKFAKQNSNAKFLAQGTLYPDMIESKSTYGSSSTIKSHHNVGGIPKKMSLNLLEPLSSFFKDEVRKLGKQLKLDKFILNRHPFPGPGLAIRIPGNITLKKIHILQEADDIFINSLKKKGLYHKIWQAYCALLPVKSVGVMGDSRTYENICLLRAVTSEDGMTASFYQFENSYLEEISNEIINSVPGINRVVYDITSKPPGTIELE